MRLDRDELGLHAPAGRVFRIVEAAGERDALERRQLLEDLGLLVLRQVFEDRDRVVGIELAHALGDRFGRQLVEDLLADRIVDLGQRGEVEVAPHQLDQARSQLRIERLDDVADVGFVQVADQRQHRRPISSLDGLAHALHELLAQRSVVLAQFDGWPSHGHVFYRRACRARVNGKGIYRACTPAP